MKSYLHRFCFYGGTSYDFCFSLWFTWTWKQKYAWFKIIEDDKWIILCENIALHYPFLLFTAGDSVLVIWQLDRACYVACLWVSDGLYNIQVSTRWPIYYRRHLQRHWTEKEILYCKPNFTVVYSRGPITWRPWSVRPQTGPLNERWPRSSTLNGILGYNELIQPLKVSDK